MRINIIRLLSCPTCQRNLVFSLQKKVRGRVIEGELQCERCAKKYHIKNGIACFTLRRTKQTSKEIQKMHKITLEQEIPKTWLCHFSRKERVSLQREWDSMLSVINKRQHAVHLDFATGTGRFLGYIIPETKCNIIALEKDFPTCQELQYFLTKTNKYDRVSIVCADARSMPFKENVFDSATSWHGFDEPEMGKALYESKRVLKDGAYLSISRMHYQKGSKSFSRARKNHIRFLTKKTTVQAFRRIGFQEVQSKIFFQGKWNERESYLPIYGDYYFVYAIKALKKSGTG